MTRAENRGTDAYERSMQHQLHVFRFQESPIKQSGAEALAAGDAASPLGYAEGAPFFLFSSYTSLSLGLIALDPSVVKKEPLP